MLLMSATLTIDAPRDCARLRTYLDRALTGKVRWDTVIVDCASRDGLDEQARAVIADARERHGCEVRVTGAP
jgi:hypothetical protein